MLILGAIVASWFWRLERRAADPIIDPAFFRSRPIVIACVLGAGVGALQAGGIFYPALAVASIGVSESTAAWLLLPGVVASTLASPIAGRLVNHVGAREVILVGLLLLLGSLMIFGLTDLTILGFVCAGTMSGIGMAGLLGAPLRIIVLRETNGGDHASGQGLLSVAASIGRLLGAAIVGSIATSAGGGAIGYQAAFVGMALLAGILFVVGATLRPHRPTADGATEATASA